MSRIKHNLPTVVLTGRTNVGKSTFFNCLTEKKQAIVSDIAGTTRDLNTGICEWGGHKMQLIDTAGLDVESQESVDKESLKRAKKSFKEADVIVLVVDGRDGILPQDKKFAQMIKKTQKPLLLIVNKIDGPRHRSLISEFHKLNLGNPWAVSAKNGVGSGDFLDELIKQLQKSGALEDKDKDLPEDTLRIAIVGKPNVGKSSLFNAIAGEERAIVSEKPHATRDTQDVLIEYSHPKLKTDQAHFLFIDTAGVRRRAKVKQTIERLSISKSFSAIQRADIVLLLFDISEKITHQDLALVEKILEDRKGLVLVANKWDKVPDKTTETDKEYRDYVMNNFRFLKWAPLVFVSAKSTFNVTKLLNLIYEIWEGRNQRIPDKAMERLMQRIVKIKKPVTHSGPEKPRILSIAQENTNPPRFVVKLSKGHGLHFSYLRFIENQIREKFGFMGTPIVLRVEKTKKRKHVTL